MEHGGFTTHPDDPGQPGAGALALLVDVLDRPPAELTDGEAHDALVGLIELSGRVHAAMARLADSFDSRGLAPADGARSTASWLAARTEVSRPAAHTLVKTGRALRACPAVDAAAGAGRLGAAKVAMLVEARRGVEDLFAPREAELVELIAPLTVAQARTAVDMWRRMALAKAGKDDGPEPGDDPSRNTLTCSETFQGRWHLAGDLDATAGAALAKHLEDWIDHQIRAGAVAADDTRPRAARRADALVALTTAGAAHQPGATQTRADVTLSWDADDLLGTPIADLAALARRHCALTNAGTALARAAAEEALCNARVTDLLVRFDLDGNRTILGTTHTRRHPTRRERTVLDERDGGCMFPGCDAPTRWCHAHHTIPYEIGHHTRLDELVLLCAHHHRQVHRGYTLTRSTRGVIRVARPDGTELPGTPPGTPPGTKIPTAPRTRPARPPRPPRSQIEPERFDPVHQATMDAALEHRLLELLEYRRTA